MDVVLAAYSMQRILEDSSYCGTTEHTSRQHLFYMIQQITRKVVQDDKAHRYLGWIQGCVCEAGVATLDEIKVINRNSFEDP